MPRKFGLQPSVSASGLPSRTVGRRAHCSGHTRWRCAVAEEVSDNGDVRTHSGVASTRALMCGARLRGCAERAYADVLSARALRCSHVVASGSYHEMSDNCGGSLFWSVPGGQSETREDQLRAVE